MKYVYIVDQMTFELKGIYQIGEEISFEMDEETNSTSTIQLPLKDNLGNNIDYNIQELDIIDIRENEKSLYLGIVSKVNETQFFEISFKDIINIFDIKIDAGAGSYNRIQKTIGVEDALQNAISALFTTGPYAQNGIIIQVGSHTTVNANIPTENGIFNLATYMNNVKIWYDIAIDFKLESTRDPDMMDLIISINKVTESGMKIVDLNTMTEKVEEAFSGNVLACVTAIGPKYVDGTDLTQIDTYILRTDRTIKSLNEGTADIVFGKRTTIYVDDWSTYVTEITNQFKGNSYDHLFQFTTNIDLKVGEKIIIYTTKGEKIESYVSGKKWINGGYEYKTGKMRIKFIDKFLKEKRG